MKKLAECLLRRKELQQKIDNMKPLTTADVYEVKVKRMNVTESIDDVTLQIPKLTSAQVNAEFNYYAKQLRLVDAAIQQTNWTADVDLVDGCFEDYTEVK